MRSAWSFGVRRAADVSQRPRAAMNVLVCTPGRLLQHMDETPGFEAGGLQVLILDEADRILDMVRPYPNPSRAQRASLIAPPPPGPPAADAASADTAVRLNPSLKPSRRAPC